MIKISYNLNNYVINVYENNLIDYNCNGERYANFITLPEDAKEVFYNIILTHNLKIGNFLLEDNSE